MTTLDTAGLRKQARELFSRSGPGYRSLILVYTLVTLGVNLVVLFLGQYLAGATDDLGGLTNAGSRAALGSLSMLLPLVSSLGLMLLDAGFSCSVLDVSRGRDPQPKDLLQALPQTHKILWTGVKMTLLMIPVMYLLAMVISMVITPVILSQSEALVTAFLEATSQQQQMEAMMAILTPERLNGMVTGMLILSYGFLLILFFRRRLAFFFLQDHPDVPAGFLSKGSIGLLKGYSKDFLRLDLGFWWYYVLIGVSVGLSMLDPAWFSFLPISSEAVTMILSVIGLVLQAALFYYGKSRIWIAYALAYDQVLTWKRAQREKSRIPQETGNPQESF